MLCTVINAKTLFSVINEDRTRSSAFDAIDRDMNGVLSLDELSYASEQVNAIFPGLNKAVTFRPFGKAEFMETKTTLKSVESVSIYTEEILNNDTNIVKYVNEARSSHCASKRKFGVKKLTFNEIRKRCLKNNSSCQSMIEDCRIGQEPKPITLRPKLRDLCRSIPCVSGIGIFTLGLMVIMSVFAAILLSVFIATSPFWLGVIFLILIYDGIRERKGQQSVLM